jgi:ferrous iron transporter FeoB
MICALVGNQNSGKTTLFNALTGSNQKVGNWPGVTIEKKVGVIKGTNLDIVDLPGIYSLSPYTSEEEVSRKFCFEEKPDLIINIIDATSLERSLYLTTQLLELDSDVIIALNMEDMLNKAGIKIDVNKLSEKLGCTIVSISAKKGIGINNLIETINTKKYKKNPHLKIYPEDIEWVIEDNIKYFPKDFAFNKRFSAVKLIEHDNEYLVLSNSHNKEHISELEKKYDMDGEQLIADKRYNFIGELKKECVKVSPRPETITDKLDKVFLNKWLAIPIFVVVMALVYMLSVGIIGGLTVNIIDMLFNGTDVLELSIFATSWEIPVNFLGLGPWLGGLLSNAGASLWAVNLVQNGIISAIGAVCNFVPQIIILFTCLSILETTGYMNRISFFLDRVFHNFGLSGKSLIPFILGSGCSVPGIMACRTVEDPDERHLSIILTPFIPCNAKLPIIALFASYFFGPSSWLVSFSLYLLAVVIILVCGVVLKKLFYKGHSSTFISELPAYQTPSFKYVVRDVGDKTLAFIKRAGSVIVVCSVVVWFLGSFTWNMTYVDNVNVTIESSILASIGNAFAWFFYIMLGGNYSWAATVSAIQGLVAKEQVISSMTVIAGISNSGATAANIFESASFSFFTPWSAYAFLVFNLFSAPCFGAIGAMHRELGSFKYTLRAIAFQIGLAWVLASLIGGIGWLIA